MTTIENKIRESFKSELGEYPLSIKIDGEIVSADGFCCVLLDGKKIKKTHKLAWRRER